MTLNLHDPDELRSLAELLSDEAPDATRIALLSGEVASGRRYLLAAAAQAARDEGCELTLLTLDLDGYEPGIISPEDFVAHQAARRGADSRAALRVLEIIAGRGAPASIFDATLLSLVLDAPDADLSPIADAPSSAEAFDQALAALSAATRLVVHVLEAATLPLTLRDRLIEEASRNENFRLIYSCSNNDSSKKLAEGYDTARFEMLPVDAGELASKLDPPMPRETLDVVLAAVGGSPGALVRRVEQLRQASDPEAEARTPEPWRLALDDLPEHRRKIVENFLFRAALCGETVPVDALLESLGAVESERDDWVDLIDETIGADSDAGLFDDRFGHPAFPGRLVYSFSDSLTARSIRDLLSSGDRAKLAGELVAVLSAKLPPDTRSAVRLYANLMRYAGSTEERLLFERALLWWSDEAETPEMAERMRESVQDGRRPPQQVFAVITLIAPFWPAARLAALVEALAIEGTPEEARGLLHALRAGLFAELGRFGEAEREAAAGLDAVSEDPVSRCALLTSLGAACVGLGREQEAEQPFAEAAELRRRLASVEDRVMRVRILHRAGMLRLDLAPVAVSADG